MSRELWEIVPVTKVVVGDHVKTYDGSDVVWTEKEVGKAVIWKDDCVFRRATDAEDPRVLRRAILLMDRSWLQGMGLRNTKYYIEKASKELESEGNDDQAR